MFQYQDNVEFCVFRIGRFKYLFKYVFKGNDRVPVQLVRGQQHYDGISHFQDGRYVSASEALWRVFRIETIYKSPTVVRLDVHLENHHTLYFRKGRESKLQPNQDLAQSSQNGLLKIKNTQALFKLRTQTSHATLRVTKSLSFRHLELSSAFGGVMFHVELIYMTTSTFVTLIEKGKMSLDAYTR